MPRNREPKGVYLWLAGINPEPWTPGEQGKIMAKGGRMIPGWIKDPKLSAYQDAVKEEFERLYGYEHRRPPKTPIRIKFYFWRSTVAGQPADATNLQKATEDALQGFIYTNDRSVRAISSEIVEQGPGVVTPAILIWVADHFEPTDGLPELPPAARSKAVDAQRREALNVEDVF